MEQIQKEGITGSLVGKMIEEHAATRAKLISAYERYKASLEGVPILQRKPIEYEDFETGAIRRIDNKVNNRLNNSFDAEIVDTKTGYMFGHPINYELDETAQTLKSLSEAIKEFNLRNNVEDKDSEWGKKAAICGYSTRLAYIDTEGKERIMNVNPWDVILLCTEDMTEPQYALRYYYVGDAEIQAEFYDKDMVHTFSNKNNGFGYTDVPRAHLFDYCPLFGLPNNEELMADAEKVYSLIDAYDRTLSDANNEIEQYRLAYLVLKGMGADDETLEQLKRSGVFELLGDNDEVSYLTKNINDSLIENHLNRLEENIMRFAKSVNFSDESFGNISGVALRFKMMALENKCITMERKMTAALRYQYKVLCSAWAKRGICSESDYLNVWFQFKRNIPVNVLEEADTTMKLKGLVSEATRLSQLSFVDDVDYELEQMEQEKEGVIDLDKVGEGDGESGQFRGTAPQVSGEEA